MTKKRSWISNLFYVLKDLRTYSWVGIPYLILDVVTTLLSALTGTLTSYFVVQALVTGENVSSYLTTIAILVSITFVFEAIRLWTSNGYTWKSTFSRISTSWVRISEKAIRTDYLNIEPREKRKTFEKGFSALDSNWIGIEGMMKQAPNLLVGFFGMLIYAIIAGIYVPWILLVMLAMFISNFLFSLWGQNYIFRKRDEEETLYHKKWVLDNNLTQIENAKDIRAYHLNHWFDNLYEVLSRSIFSLEAKERLRPFLAGVSDNIFLFVRDLVAYSLLINLVATNSISLGTFTFLIGIVAGFSTWVNNFSTAFNKARECSIAIDDYRNALNVPDTMKHDKGLDVTVLKKPLEIVFDHVYFAYPGEKQDTLKDINLTLKAGEKLALVGNNGAGKTTLVKLLCGLYAPKSGRILINGHNINEFNSEDYMTLISALFQDVNPLAFTIKRNVTCQSDEKTDEKKLKDCLQKAGLYERVQTLPEKENTYITQRFSLKGVELSGGEAQKLLLARALYKGAPLLLLDEPTSALDPLSEEKMYREYLAFSKGNTSLFISHRLASTRFCDRIVFLCHGQIAAIGTHKELMAHCPAYHEMFSLQAKYYQEGGKEHE